MILYKFQVYNILIFHNYIPYKVITTRNPLSVTIQSYFDNIDCISYAVLYIPMTYLCYTFVPLNLLHLFAHTSTAQPSRNYLFSVSVHLFVHFISFF